MKEWLRVGGFSGLESFVRNIAFMLMIVRMINVVGEQGTFWVANNFIWESFIKNVMNIENHMDVYRIAIISVVFYITFAFNNVIDSIFYGIGKTNYMLFQSLVINTVFYGTFYILYKMGLYKPTLDLIALMFAAGIAFDSILTYGMFAWMLKKRKIKIIEFEENLNSYVEG